MTHKEYSSLLMKLFEDYLNNWSVRTKYKLMILEMPEGSFEHQTFYRLSWMITKNKWKMYLNSLYMIVGVSTLGYVEILKPSRQKVTVF